MDKRQPRKRVFVVRLGTLEWVRVSPIRALQLAISIKKAFPHARVHVKSEMRDWYPRA